MNILTHLAEELLGGDHRVVVLNAASKRIIDRTRLGEPERDDLHYFHVEALVVVDEAEWRAIRARSEGDVARPGRCRTEARYLA